MVLCRLIAAKGTASASLTKRIFFFFFRLSHLFASSHFYEVEEAFNVAHAPASTEKDLHFFWFIIGSTNPIGHGETGAETCLSVILQYFELWTSVFFFFIIYFFFF